MLKMGWGKLSDFFYLIIYIYYDGAKIRFFFDTDNHILLVF